MPNATQLHPLAPTDPCDDCHGVGREYVEASDRSYLCAACDGAGEVPARCVDCCRARAVAVVRDEPLCNACAPRLAAVSCGCCGAGAVVEAHEIAEDHFCDPCASSYEAHVEHYGTASRRTPPHRCSHEARA